MDEQQQPIEYDFSPLTNLRSCLLLAISLLISPHFPFQTYLTSYIKDRVSHKNNIKNIWIPMQTKDIWTQLAFRFIRHQTSSQSFSLKEHKLMHLK